MGGGLTTEAAGREAGRVGFLEALGIPLIA